VTNSGGRRFATRCAHAGSAAAGATDTTGTTGARHGAVNEPIQFSTTFVQPDVARPKRYDYSRGGNPTRERLETAIADLEGAAHGFAFASGLSALDAVLRTMSAGDHVVAAEDAYGGSIRLLTRVASRQGIETTFVDTREPTAVRSALTGRTKWVLLETPTNPLLRVSDIAAVAKIAHDGGARLVVDNTFMSPALQNPLALGADAVFHSATKYIGGHSDVLAGLVVVDDDALANELRFLQMAVGAVLPAFDCNLLLRGLRTLHLRMARHCENAAWLARQLAAHPAVFKVYFPGLDDHPGHDLHAVQARGPGGIISFRVRDADAARAVATSTRVWQLAESLGAVESLIQVPVAMTHASVPPDLRARTNLDAGLIRLSVGIEDKEDLWSDLDRALQTAQSMEKTSAAV
jgi:cystathionine gamma-lyase/homocysteine desulfhydrase